MIRNKYLLIIPSTLLILSLVGITQLWKFDTTTCGKITFMHESKDGYTHDYIMYTKEKGQFEDVKRSVSYKTYMTNKVGDEICFRESNVLFENLIQIFLFLSIAWILAYLIFNSRL